MKRVFLLTYSSSLGDRQKLKEVVNSDPTVLAWRYDLPNCFYLLSERTAKEIATSLRTKLTDGQFIVTRADDDYWGYSSDATWHLFVNKALKPSGDA